MRAVILCLVKPFLCRSLPVAFLFAIPLLALALARAQDEAVAPLYAENFDLGTGDWVGVGQSASVSPALEAADIKAGSGALRFDYRATSGQTNILIKPLEPGALRGLKSVSFWVRADHSTALLFAVQERGGGRFGCFFSVVKDRWQRVEIALEDLLLQDDTPDADGKLDAAQIEAVVLADFNQYLVEMIAKNPGRVSRLLEAPDDKNRLWLDELAMSAQPLENAKPKDPKVLVLDDFSRPQIAWVGLGTPAIERVTSENGKDGELQIGYRQSAEKLTGLFKIIETGALAGKTALTVKIASTRAAAILVQLEEQGTENEGKYNFVFNVPAGNAMTEFKAPFTAFQRDDQARDQNNQLDIDRVNRITIVDISGFMGAGGDNALWLSQLRAQ